MANWIKIAKERQLNDYLDSVKRADEDRQRTEEMKETEKNWMDLVQKRVDEVNAEGFFIHAIKKDDSLRLVSKGEAEIELLPRFGFSITYKNILPPTTLLLRNAIFVHHHRVVKVRELNAHNIEEIMKFVALGMKEYLKISDQSRIEHNLEGLIETLKKDEHEISG
jgi:hypothetical protein